MDIPENSMSGSPPSKSSHPGAGDDERGRTASDLILIEGLEFYGFHGVPDEEQAVGHRYAVDVRLQVDLRVAGETDRVGDTVNYAAVARTVLRIGTGKQYRLLERLGAQMADAILEEYALVHAVTLRVRKLYPPMKAIVASVGVEISRTRG